MPRQPDPISIVARSIIAGLMAVLLGLLGWFGSQNQAVHTVLFQGAARDRAAFDSRLDKLERDAAAMKERVRALSPRTR
jgi:hypothetical protein